MIIGQAPGTKVHTTGIPWNDPSGDLLRTWLAMEREQFYNPDMLAIMPMGFCYPGKGKSGDLPPRPECAPKWHPQVFEQIPRLDMILLVGQYAQNAYLPKEQTRGSMQQRLMDWDYESGKFLPLPHPSPRNRRWLKTNAWFEQRVIPIIRKRFWNALENPRY